MANITFDKIIEIARGYCGRYEPVTTSILIDLKEKFRDAYCASKVHHDYKGGLMDHTKEVVDLCFSISNIYYDDIDMDLLISGAILHDIGKIFTYEEVSGGKADKTYIGELEEHLYVGAELINEYRDKVETKLDLSLLKHMILSHHGKREWGSPVTPRTREAYILHQCDLLSARMVTFNKKIEENKKEGLFTSKDDFIGGKIFKGVQNER